MLFAHANEPIIRGNHKQAVVGATGEQTKNGCSQVLLVASQIAKRNNLGTALSDIFP